MVSKLFIVELYGYSARTGKSEMHLYRLIAGEGCKLQKMRTTQFI